MSSSYDNWKWVFLEITNRCNFDCLFCPSGVCNRPREDMSRAFAANTIDQIHDFGYRGKIAFHVLGEPLLHPEVFSIIDHAAGRGLTPILLTNGGALKDEVIVDLFQARIAELVISMQTINRRAYEKLRHTPFGWEVYRDRIRRALMLANDPDVNKIGCSVRLSIGMKKPDAGHPDDVYFDDYESSNEIKASVSDLLTDLDNVDIEPLFSTLDAAFSKQVSRISLGKQVSVSIKQMGNWRRIFDNIPVKTGRCKWFGNEIAVLVNGDVTFCHLDYDGRTSIGNLNKQPLAHILESPEYIDLAAAFTAGTSVPFGCTACRGVEPMTNKAMNGTSQPRRP